MYYPGLGSAFSVEQGLDFLENLDPISKKLVNLKTTAIEKQSIVDAIGLKKDLDLNGYYDVQANFSDGDSGTYIDKYGRQKQFRLADVNRIDSFDQMRDVFNSKSKRLRQPKQVAQLLGKPSEYLTEEDYNQADKYHSYAINHMLNTGETLPFNPHIDYNRFESTPVGLAFRKIGEDKYGRDLVEAINPRTGDTVSFDLSNNAQLNANFDLFKSLDTASNRLRLEQQNKKYEDYERSQQIRRANRENRFGEAIDMVQSNAAQSVARAIDFMPDAMKDLLGIDKKKWAKRAGPLGEMLADKEFGVDPTTREDYSLAMQKSAKDFEEGNYGSALWEAIKNFDRILADSAVQSSLAMAGAATGGLGLGALGVTSQLGLNLGRAIGGGILAGADETLSNLQEYKQKHGKDMDSAEALKLFLGHIPIAGAEGLLGLAGAKRLSEAAKKSLKDMTWKEFGKEAAQSFGKSAAYEGIQEDIQQSWGQLFQDPNATIADFLDVVTRPENLHAGMIGSVMGGGLSLGNTALRAGAKKFGPKVQETLERRKEEKLAAQNVQSPLEPEAPSRAFNEDADNAAKITLTNALKGINDESKTLEDLSNMYKEVDDLQYDLDVSQEANRVAGKVRNKILRRMAENLDKDDFANKIKDLGLTVNDVWEDIVNYSLDPEYIKEEFGKEEITNEDKLKITKVLSEMGKKLGLGDEFVKKTIEDVSRDVASGLYSVGNYVKQAKRHMTLAMKKAEEDPDYADRHTEVAQRNLEDLAYLVHSQLHKLNQFKDAAIRIAEGHSNSEEFIFKSTYGKFKLDGEFLQKKNYNRDNVGAHAIVKDIMRHTGKASSEIAKMMKAPYADRLDFSSIEKIGKTFNRKNIEREYREAANAIFYGTEFKRTSALPPGSDASIEPTSSIVNTFTKVPTPIRNTISTITNALVYQNIDQRNNMPVAEMKALIDRGLERVTDPQQKKIANSVLTSFSKNQTSVRDLAGKLHSHYRNKQNVSRANIVSALLNDLYNRAINENWSDNKIDRIVSNLSRDISRLVYKENDPESSIPNVNKYLDELFEGLKGRDIAPTTQPNPAQTNPPATTENPGNPPATGTENKTNPSQPPATIEGTPPVTLGDDAELGSEENPDSQESMDTAAQMLAALLGGQSKTTNEGGSNPPSTTDSNPPSTTEGNSPAETNNDGNDGKIYVPELGGWFTVDELNDLFSGSVSTDEATETFDSEEMNPGSTAPTGSSGKKTEFSKRSGKIRAALKTLGITESFGSKETARQKALEESLMSHLNGLDVNEDELTGDEITEDIADSNGVDIPAYQTLMNYKRNKSIKFPTVFYDVFKELGKAIGKGKTNKTLSLVAQKGIPNDKVSMRITEDYIDNILTYIVPDLSEGIQGIKNENDKIDYAMQFLFNAGKGVKAKDAFWKTNPAIPLLFDFNHGNKEITMTVNPVAALIVRLASLEALTTLDISNVIKRGTAEQLASTFGMEEQEMSSLEQRQAARWVAKNIGVPDSGTVQHGGNAFMKIANLGRVSNSKQSFGMWNRAIEGIGQFVVDALQQEGLLIRDGIIPGFNKDGTMPKGGLEERMANDPFLTEDQKAEIRKMFKNAVATVRPAMDNTGKPLDISAYTEAYLGKFNYETGKMEGGFANYYETQSFNIRSGILSKLGSPAKLKVANANRYTSGFAKTTEEQRESMDRLQNTQLVMTSPSAIQKLLSPENRSALLKKLGFNIDIDNMSLDSVNSTAGKDQAILRDLNDFETIVQLMTDNEGTGFQPRVFPTRNGRINYEGYSPQGHKPFRHFFAPQECEIEYDYSDNTRKLEAFAVSQAFDCITEDANNDIKLLDWFDSLDVKQLSTMQDDFLNMSEKEFGEKYNPMIKKFNGFDVELGCENFSQCYILFDHFIKKKESNGKKFKTFVQVELDSTTSGYFLRILQMPEKKVVELLTKLGVREVNDPFAYMSIDRVKRIENDIYRHLGVNASNNIESIYTNIESATKEELDEVLDEQFSSSIIDRKILHNTFENLKGFLPRAKDGKISGAFRNLIKIIAIPFGYNAGKASTKRVLSRELTTQILDKYMEVWSFKDDNDPSLVNLWNRFETANKMRLDKGELKGYKSAFKAVQSLNQDADPEFIRNQLLDKESSNVILKTKDKWGKTIDRSIDKILSDVIGCTYGDAMWEAMDAHFKDVRPINAAINNAMQNISKIFRDRVNKELESRFNKSTTGLTEADFREVVESLSDLMPEIPHYFTYDSNMNVQSMSFLRMKKATGNDTFKIMNEVKRLYTRAYKNSDGTTKKTTIVRHSYAAQQMFDLLDQAAAVLSIHYMDGIVAQTVVNNIPGLVLIHDAICCSINQMEEVGKSYNHNGYVASLNNDIVTKISDRFHDIFDKLTDEEKAAPLINAQRRALTRDTTFQVDKAFEEEVNAKIAEYKAATKEKYNLDVVTTEQLDELIKKYSGLEMTGNMVDINVGYSYTWADYAVEVKRLAVNNTMDRANLASKPKVISNMGGENVSDYVSTTDILDNILYHDKETFYNSSPDGFTTNGQQADILQYGLDSKDARKFTNRKLHGMAKQFGQTVESDEHMEFLDNLHDHLNTEHCKEYQVLYNMNGRGNYGQANISQKKIFIESYNNTGRKASQKMLATMPLASMYSHEVVHVATTPGIENPTAFGTGHLVRDLHDLVRDYLKNGGSWLDLMPDNYDPSMENVLKSNAKKAFDYIIGKNGKGGLAEFIAYGLTYEPFRKALNKMDTLKDVSKIPLGTRLYNLAVELFKLVTFNGDLRSVMDKMAELVGGRNVTPKYQTMFDALYDMSMKLNKANVKATKKLSSNPLSLASDMHQTMVDSLRGTNQKLSRIFKSLFDNDKFAKYEWKVRPNDGKISIAAKLPKIALRAAFDRNARKSFGAWCQAMMGLSQTGVFMSLLRDITPDDDQTNALNQRATLARMFEANAKKWEKTYLNNILQGFKNEPTEIQLNSLTTTILQTDAQSLLDKGYTHKQIFRLMRDKDYRIAEIQKSKDSIAGKIESKNVRNYLYNQALATALYAMDKEGNEATSINAMLIARAKGITNESMIDEIDKLSTLYAIDLVDDEDIEIMSTMDEAGLSNYINIARNYAKSINDGTSMRDTLLPTRTDIQFTPSKSFQIQKGFVPYVSDSSSGYRLAPVNDMSNQTADGYVINGKTVWNPGNGLPEMALYEKSYANMNTRDGTAFIMRGQNLFSEAISSSAYRMAHDKAPDDTAFVSQRKDYMSRLNDRRKRIIEMMENKEMSANEIRALNSHFVPVYTRNKFDKLVITDYQIVVPSKIRNEVMQCSQNGAELLSKMFASQYTMEMSKFQNQRIVSFLIDDMNRNMTRGRVGKYNNIKYIRFNESSIRNHFTDKDLVIPRQILEIAEGTELYVREDWLLTLFGNESLSLADAPGIKKFMPNIIKTGIRLGEYCMKMVASLVKTNILFKVPSVLVNNFISNMMYSIMTGSNPLRVMKLTFDNIIHTFEYMKDNKALSSLLMKQKLGTAKKYEIVQIDVLQQKLKDNPISEIIEYGFLQSIIDDVNSNDVKNLKKVTKAISDTRLYNMIPDIGKKAIKMMYMPEGTPIYDLMANLTQISDFASRATEYQLRMEKAPAKFIEGKGSDGKIRMVPNDKYSEYKRDLIVELWQAFVNYDVPQSSVAQYLNDLGLTMFTKYFFRIHKAISSNLIKNPINALAFMITGSLFTTPDNIMNQTIFHKDITSFFHSPVDNFVNAIVSMPVQYATGMENFKLI